MSLSLVVLSAAAPAFVSFKKENCDEEREGEEAGLVWSKVVGGGRFKNEKAETVDDDGDKDGRGPVSPLSCCSATSKSACDLGDAV